MYFEWFGYIRIHYNTIELGGWVGVLDSTGWDGLGWDGLGWAGMDSCMYVLY